MISSRIDECTVAGVARPENFPVASLLLARNDRAAVRAFYRFARFADDIADSPDLASERKLAALAALDAALLGERAIADAVDVSPAEALRAALAARGLETTQARVLLGAFRRDAENRGTPTWADLMAYCRASAAPVGRFLLDLHREPRRALDAADALCAALQVLNHLQDIGEDYRLRKRIYLPLAWPDGTCADLADLDRTSLTPNLRACVDRALERTARLLDRADTLPALLTSPRLRAEAAAILSLAHALARRLHSGDPLARRIRPTSGDAARAAAAALRALVRPPPVCLLGAAQRREINAIVAKSGSSFRLGLACLPRPRRDAMRTLYAFCRVLDDIADEPGPTSAERHAQLDAWETCLSALESRTEVEDPPALVAALAAVNERYGLDFAECRALIAGMRMDVDGPMVAPEDEAFRLYCRRVAVSVGLIALPLMGATDPGARRFAAELGHALQCVNIIRDVAEDAAIGRCYLPRELLLAHGIASIKAAEIVRHPNLGAVRARLAARARAHFAAALEDLPSEDCSELLPARLMMAAYQDVLDRIEANGWETLKPPPRPGKIKRLLCLFRLPRPRGS
jgi:hydroxysqualene synthase